ncbi:MAG TPA: glycosyltransferase family A protein [Gaiellaceae bacterium]|nr:glycosyltransferase family A protein [Gaiellaceae bacterium]
MTARDDRLVSVIITVYNGAAYLHEAIESVLRQTYEPVELVVLDDGSTDGSGDVALRYGSALRYARQENAGMGGARNSALRLARGSFLSFLDADDRFVETKVELQMACLDENPDVDMVFGHMTEFVSPDVDEQTARLLRAPVHDVPWRTPNLMLVRRRSFERVGPFSTELRVGIGVDWYARAVERGLREHVLPSIVLERRLHAGNNGIRYRDARLQYLHVLKSSLDRRRASSDERRSED